MKRIAMYTVFSFALLSLSTIMSCSTTISCNTVQDSVVQDTFTVSVEQKYCDFIAERYPNSDTENHMAIVQAVTRECRNYGVPDTVVLGIISKESDFNPMCIGAAGERGLVQILPSTARIVCKMEGIEYDRQKLHDIEYNIKLGVSYFAYNLYRYNSDVSRALVAYNAGNGYTGSNAYSRDVLRRARQFCD